VSDERPYIYIGTPIRNVPQHPDLKEDLSNVFQFLEKEYTQPILELMHDATLPYRIKVLLCPYAGIARARNKIAADFLKDPKGWMLFFADYDLCPTADDYKRIISKNMLVLGGLYATREKNCHWVLNSYIGPEPDKDGIWQVCELGTGFKCFHRQAFEKILAAYPWLEHEADDHPGVNEWGFFSMGVVQFENKRRWLTEDYWFDSLFREIKIPIFADTTVRLKHRHTNQNGEKLLFPLEAPPIPIQKFALTA